jgi:anti-sigma-K factor RskA
MPVEVEIRFDNRTLATTRADGLRQDLARAGVADGRHAFQFLLGEPVPPDQKGLISAVVRCGRDGPFAPLVNRTVQQHANLAQGQDAAAAGQQMRGSSELRAVLSALAATRKGDRGPTRYCGRRVPLGCRRAYATVNAAARSTQEKIEGLRASQEALERQVSAMEVFQARFDAAVATLARSEEATQHAHGADRWLAVVVTAIGLISCISLVLGLISVL